MRTKLFILFAFIGLLFAGCEHDNFDEPNVILSGKITYNDVPLGVRTKGTQLELWQDGYQLFTKIPVHIAHDGSFSAAIFDGSYKMVRLAGAPWEPQSSDTILVNVRGNTIVDVPVNPYFIIKNESFQKGAGTITAKFTVEKIVASANVHSINLYLGRNLLTDHNYNEKNVGLDLVDLTLGSEATITTDIPANLMDEDYIFVRVGVRSSMSNEYLYTQVQKFELK